MKKFKISGYLEKELNQVYLSPLNSTINRSKASLMRSLLFERLTTRQLLRTRSRTISNSFCWCFCLRKEISSLRRPIPPNQSSVWLTPVLSSHRLNLLAFLLASFLILSKLLDYQHFLLIKDAKQIIKNALWELASALPHSLSQS